MRRKLWMMAFAVLTLSARAETPYERDQREQLEQYQKQHGLSPQQQQILRWKQQWSHDHPGEPMPNLGVLEKLHQDEIMANTNASMDRMRQERQAQLRREHQEAIQRQTQILAAQHISWSDAQWHQWEERYQQQKQQEARDYGNASAQSGEMAREEAAAHPQH